MVAKAAQSRVSRLATELVEAGIDAFFAWHPVSTAYLHGFGEYAHERFLVLAIRSTGETAIICPSLSATVASRAGIRDIRSWKDGEDPVALFKGLAGEWGLRSAILLVDDEMPAKMLLSMQEALPAALFKPSQEVLSRLMRKKDEGELQRMREAASIADRAFPAAVRAIRPGATEREVADVLQAEMQKLGGTPTFCIVASGANAAEPHHQSDDTRIESGDAVLLDFGCAWQGYNSDITRVVSCEQPSEEAKRVYDIVYRAQAAGRAAIRPGATAQDIDRATRRVIEQEGYGEFFIHRTGHGIGMRGHEDPYIVEGNDRPLEPGECFSVEPGIYLPGRLGVRIENIVAYTESGHESFNEEPSETLAQA